MRRAAAVLLLTPFVFSAPAFANLVIHRRAVDDGSITVNTAVFDSTNDYMRLSSSGPTGLADGTLFTCSYWLRIDASTTDSGILRITTNTGGTRLAFYYDVGGVWNVVGRNSSGTTVLAATGTATVAADGVWRHYLWIIDMSASANTKLYIDGTSDALTFGTFTSGQTLDVVGTSYRYTVGGGGGAADPQIDAALAELFFDDVKIDDPTKFRSASGHPIDLGSDGSTPGGSQPVFYYKGSGNGFVTNSGTGGDMTLTGSLGTTTSP